MGNHHHYHLNPRHWLVICTIIGLGLRILFIWQSNHLFHPDELYQALEPAHRLVFGYGIVPWDYQYGLRSYILPFLLSLLMRLAPATYLTLIKIVLAFGSLTLIPAAYVIAETVSGKPKTGLAAAFLAAIWYELVYFSPRALTEVVSTYCFAAVLILFLKRPRLMLLTGCILAWASLLRIQYALLVPLFAYWCLTRNTRRRFTHLILGFVLGLVVYGSADIFTYGSFLAHLVNNVRISFLSGISEQFGIKPWWFYLTGLLSTSGGLALLVIPALRFPRARPYALGFGAILLLHSLIPHKEYRFAFILIPLGLTLAVIGLSKSVKSVTPPFFLLLGLVSLLGVADRLPRQSHLYAQPLLLRDPVFDLTAAIPAGTGCSVSYPDRSWVFQGGYTILHQPLEIYTADYPAPAAPSYLLLPNSVTPPPGYASLRRSPPYQLYLDGVRQTHPGYSLYASKSPCQPNPEYTYKRSFDNLSGYLKSYRGY